MAGIKRRGTTPEGNKEEYAKLKNGDYEARLVYVADLGLQEREYKGEKKPDAQQLALGFEVLGEYVTINEVEVPRILWTRPFNVFNVLTAKGKELEYMKIFNPTASDGEEGDWESVLGTPVSLTVGKRQSAKGQEFDNINNIAAIPAKYHKDVAASDIEPAIGDCDDPDNVVNKALFGLVKLVLDKRVVKEEY